MNRLGRFLRSLRALWAVAGEQTRLELGPDDILVVHVPHMLSAAASERVAEGIAFIVGIPRRRILILEADMRLGVIRGVGTVVARPGAA